MQPVAERVKCQRFWAFAAVEAMPYAWERVKQLVECGRPMIYTERYMGCAGEMRVMPGLHLHQQGFRPGAYFESDDEKAGFGVTLMPGINGLGMWGYSYEGSEADAAVRFHAKRDGARIDVEGFGLGREDHIRITRWNEHGVGLEKAIYFQHEDADERAEREGAFLDALAARGDWTADDLRKLAESVRYEWKPALDLAEQAIRLHATTPSTEEK